MGDGGAVEVGVAQLKQESGLPSISASSTMQLLVESDVSSQHIPQNAPDVILLTQPSDSMAEKNERSLRGDSVS